MTDSNEVDRSLEDLMAERSRLDSKIDERRPNRCVAFIDMVGSTSFTDRHGDIAGKLRVNTAGEVVVPIIEDRSGKVANTLGDGWLVLFPKPTDAVQAAIQIQAEITESQKGKTEPIELKIGLDYGRVLEGADDIYGDVVNACSRIADKCGGGSILLSQQVFEGLDPFYGERCGALQESRLRGKAQVASLYELHWNTEDLELDEKQTRSLILDIHRDEDEVRVQVRNDLSGDMALISFEPKPLDTAEIEKVSDRIHHVLSTSNLKGSTRESYRDLEKCGKELFRLLFPKEVAGRIRADKSESLLFILDPQLVHFPWELAHDGADFLCCRFGTGRKARTPQATSGLRREAPTERAKMLALSNPTGDLGAATEEGEDLYRTYANDPRVDFEFLNGRGVTRETVERRLTDFDIVHYSGHAEFSADNPDESRWLLADGSFTAKELQALAEEHRPGPLLVFNNACQSGSTKSWKDAPAGWSYGLANAFLLAGATHYIGTITELLDASAKEFSRKFYRSVIAGNSVGEALRTARVNLRKEQGDANLSWAQYVLYGDPGKALFARLRTKFAAAEGKDEESADPPKSDVPEGEEKRARRDEPPSPDPDPSPEPRPVPEPSLWPKIAGIAAVIAVLLAAMFFSRPSGPTEEEVRANLTEAEAFIAAQSFPEAKTVLGELVDSKGVADNQRGRALRMLGRIADHEGDSAKAVEYYNRASEANLGDALAFSGLAALYLREGETALALAVLEKARDLSPDDKLVAGLYRLAEKNEKRRSDKDESERTKTLLEEISAQIEEGPPSTVDPWTSRPVGVAVREFEWDGGLPELGEKDGIPAVVEGAFLDLKRWPVIERGLLNEVMEIVQVGSSKVTDRRYAAQAGKFLAVRGLVCGRILRRGAETHVEMEIIDVETLSKVAMKTASTTGEVAEVAENLVREMSDQMAKDFKIQGRVQSTTRAILLNIGELHGVHVGQEFDVYMDDPGNPESVTNWRPLAKLRVTKTGRNDAACEVVESDMDLEPGMRVREEKPE